MRSVGVLLRFLCSELTAGRVYVRSEMATDRRYDVIFFKHGNEFFNTVLVAGYKASFFNRVYGNEVDVERHVFAIFAKHRRKLARGLLIIVFAAYKSVFERDPSACSGEIVAASGEERFHVPSFVDRHRGKSVFHRSPRGARWKE